VKENGMKAVWMTLIGLAVTAFATTASAHVVEITTSIPVVEASNNADLRVALEAAIDEAVKAIGFKPTVVTLQGARRVGDRIYLSLLIVDHDGEEMMKQLEADEANDSREPPTEPDDDVKTI
jgi:hypothetical protein